jgi:hypothetical protein
VSAIHLAVQTVQQRQPLCYPEGVRDTWHRAAPSFHMTNAPQDVTCKRCLRRMV